MRIFRLVMNRLPSIGVMRLEIALWHGGLVPRSPATARERWGQSCASLHLGGERPLTALVSEDQAPYDPEEHLFCWKDGTAKASGCWTCCIPSPAWGTRLWAPVNAGGGKSLTSNLRYIHTGSSLAGVWFSRAFGYAEKAEICPCWELVLNYDIPQTTAVQRGINLFIMMFKGPK